MAVRIWTAEQRARQAEAIRRWKPWNQSTGPSSAEGKAKVSRNAYAGSEWANIRQVIKKLNQLLRKQKDLLRQWLTVIAVESPKVRPPFCNLDSVGQHALILPVQMLKRNRPDRRFYCWEKRAIAKRFIASLQAL